MRIILFTLLALAFASPARADDIAALRHDKALNARAYTALGVLHYKVPGWPIGFGSDRKAKDYLDRATRRVRSRPLFNCEVFGNLVSGGAEEIFIWSTSCYPETPCGATIDRGR